MRAGLRPGLAWQSLVCDSVQHEQEVAQPCYACAPAVEAQHMVAA